jgi:Fe2+ transport system protein FeoA
MRGPASIESFRVVGELRSERQPPMKERVRTLLELGAGETATIQALHSDGPTRRRIHSMGLFEGRKVCVIARAPFKGPLLVEDAITGARVMIAQDLAGHIEVI